MNNLAQPLTLLAACCLLAACATFQPPVEPAPGEKFAGLQPYLRKSVMWKFASLDGREFPVNIYYLEETTAEPREVILYVMNRAWKRIGMENDLSILKDYLSQKFIVMTLDFGNAPEAVSPLIDDDINMIHRAIFGYQTPSILRAIKLEPKAVRCFVLPQGYRVATDLTYWEIDKHGVHGTLEYIMKTYNETIVPKVPGLKPAEKPSDMVDKNGNPFDYRIKMDIVYPSKAKKRCPVFVYAATDPERTAHHRYLFQLRGYVYVVMGHCFNPCVSHYWHFINFTLDHWNGLACYTAAIRYLNMNAAKYAMDTNHIGMMGISKGQYAVTRLSAPNHTQGEESKKYSEFPAGFGTFPDGTYGPQPWQGYPSRIHAGCQGMGMGLWESEYITPDYAPTILMCGENDRDVITKEGNPKFLMRLEELDVNHVNLFMEGLGHSIPIGYDRRLGVDRYQLVNDFFDRYLKVEEKLPPVVLIAFPRDGAEGVDAANRIWVQFAPTIDARTVCDGGGIKVFNLTDSRQVPGFWRASHGGTKFTFIPQYWLEKGKEYEVIVTKQVKDTAGTPLAQEKRFRFKTSE